MRFHGPSCQCCSEFVDSRTMTVRELSFGGKPPKIKNKNQQMGFMPVFAYIVIGTLVFKDVVEYVLYQTAKVFMYVGEQIHNIYVGVIEALGRIDWDGIIKKLGELVGNALIYFNPIHIGLKFLREFPLTRGLYNELDKFTGGAITTIDALSTITGRAMRGDPISKAEFVRCALFALQVGAVFMAGPIGSDAFKAASIGFAANQLKQGTLGETELGRTILGIASVAGYAYAAGQNIQDAFLKETSAQGQAYVLSNTELGKGDLGPLIAGIAFNAGATMYAGGDLWNSTVQYSKDYSRGVAIREAAQEIGGPYAKDIATVAVDGTRSGSFNPTNVDWRSLANGISFQEIVDGLKEVYGDVSNSIVSFMNSSGGQASFPNIDFTGIGKEVVKAGTNIIEEIKRIPTNISTMTENISFPSISSSKFPGLSIPDINSPSFSWPDFGDINWELLKDILMFEGLRALLRRRGVRATDGQLYTIYILENGSIYYVKEDNTWLLIAGAAAAAILLMGAT